MPQPKGQRRVKAYIATGGIDTMPISFVFNPTINCFSYGVFALPEYAQSYCDHFKGKIKGMKVAEVEILIPSLKGKKAK
jgi:hypothetical protein